MKKKVIILILTAIILLLIVVGVFLWPYYKQIKIEKDIERLADYVVEETSEGKIIESKSGELRVKVPEGWRIRGEKENMIGPVYILDIEASRIYQEEMQANISKLIKDLLESKTGCLITIGHVEEEKSFEEIEKEINEFSRDITLLSENTFVFKEIDQYKGVQHTLDTTSNGYWIDFLVPTKGKTYVFSAVFYRDNRDKCFQEFDKFIETISIE